MDNIIGQKFGRVCVEGIADSRATASGQVKRYAWVTCQCGVKFKTQIAKLRSGHTRSCGCLRFDSAQKRRVDSPVASHPLWRTYQGMRTRCENSKSTYYEYYGGRGITVCERWKKSFWAFVADMGEKTEHTHTLERIENGKGYSPINCRWASKSEQAKNRRKKSK